MFADSHYKRIKETPQYMNTKTQRRLLVSFLKPWSKKKTLMTLFIGLLSICLNSQTIKSANPTTSYQGGVLLMTIETSDKVPWPYSFSLKSGSTVISSEEGGEDLTNNRYKVKFLINEYDSVGDYILSYNGNNYSSPIRIDTPSYEERFQFSSVQSIAIQVTSRTLGQGIVKMALDSKKNMYCVGAFPGTAKLGSTTITSKGAQDGFIAKLDSQGVVQWVKTIGSSYGFFQERLTSIKIYNDTNIYITGNFYCDPSLTYNNSLVLKYPTNNIGDFDGILLKVSTEGDLRSYAFQGSKNTDASNDLVIDKKGNVIVTGYLQSNVSIGSATGNTYVYSEGLKDSITMKAHSSEEYGIYLAKYSPSLNVLWAKRQDVNLNSQSGANPFAIDIAPDNSLVILSRTQSKVSFDNIVCSNSRDYTNPHYNLLKLDSAGNTLWCKDAGEQSTQIRSLGHDKDGNIYFPYSDYLKDFSYLVKYDKDGNLQWEKDIHNSKYYTPFFNSVTDKNGYSYVLYAYMPNFGLNTTMVSIKKFDSLGNDIALGHSIPDAYNLNNLPTGIILNEDETEVYISGIYNGTHIYSTDTLKSSSPQVFLMKAKSFSANEGSTFTTKVIKHDISIYPNPADNIMIIEQRMMAVNAESSLVLINSLGKVIKEELITTNLQEIDISGLPTGIYNFNLIRGEQVLNTGRLSIIH